MLTIIISIATLSFFFDKGFDLSFPEPVCYMDSRSVKGESWRSVELEQKVVAMGHIVKYLINKYF